MNSTEFKRIYAFVEESTMTFDESHDVSHAYAVYKNMLKIVETIDEDIDMDVLVYCAMLHDICDHKYPNSIKESELIKFIIDGLGDTKCERVMNIINNVSFSKQIKGLRKELQYPDNIHLDIISDADRLEAIGQIGIDRCIKYTRASGGQVPEDVIKHCHEKLLILKDKYIVTSIGKQIAEPLHNIILEYIKSQ